MQIAKKNQSLSKSDKAHFAAMKESEWKPRAEKADAMREVGAAA